MKMKHLTKRAISLLLVCVLTLSLCMTALPQTKAAEAGVYLADGFYTLKMADGTFLTIGDVTGDVAPITFEAKDTSSNKQKLRIASDGQGNYTIQSV